MITKIVVPITTATIIHTATTACTISLPLTNMMYKFEKSFGIRETMLINRIMEIPLPIPLSEILSPNHMMIQLPAVNVTIIVKIVNTLLS